MEILAAKLADKGVNNIELCDVSFTHHSEILAKAFKYSHIVLASTTYNAGVFESMQAFIHSLVSHNLQNRKFVLLENGSWAATCGSQMKTELEKLTSAEILTDCFSVKSKLKENQLTELDNVVITIENSLNLI